MKSPLILYHALCADGAGAAFAAWCKFGDEAEYRAVKYGDPAPTEEHVTGRDVYILDFSYSRVELEFIDAWCGRRLKVIDHHKTAAEALAGLPFAVFDMEHSGAVLAWKHFHGDSVPQILLYIEDRDLWRWKLPHSKAVGAALESLGVREDWRVLKSYRSFTVQPIGPCELITEGLAILRQQEQQIRAIASIAERVGFDTTLSWQSGVDGFGAGKVLRVECMAANSCLLQSEAGNILAQAAADRGELPVGIIWFRDGARGVFQVSLRSVGDFDVSVIAKQYGGGGHRNAAGFVCKVLPWA